MLQGCLGHPEQWKWYALWIIEDKEGAWIGNMSFKGLNTDGSVEVGYGISDEYCGKGYATEAVKAVIDWAMGQPGIAHRNGNRSGQYGFAKSPGEMRFYPVWRNRRRRTTFYPLLIFVLSNSSVGCFP